MNRKVLLVEPNYKNKYPPMGLMKIATYFRDSGDDVRFFKGNLQEFVLELDVDDLLNNLVQMNSSINWRKYKQIFPHILIILKSGPAAYIPGYRTACMQAYLSMHLYTTIFL